MPFYSGTSVCVSPKGLLIPVVRVNWKSKCPLHLQAFEIFCLCLLLLHIFQYHSGKWRRKDRVNYVSQIKIPQHWQNLLCLCQVSNSLKIKLGPELLQTLFSVNNLGKKSNQPNKTLNKEKKLSPVISVRAMLPNPLEASHSSSDVPCCQVAGNRGWKNVLKSRLKGSREIACQLESMTARNLWICFANEKNLTRFTLGWAHWGGGGGFNLSIC